MKGLRWSAGSVVRLILCFFVCAGTSCTVGDIYYGDYYGDDRQKISISADSTFLYSTPGLMDKPTILTGTWTRNARKLLLHAKESDTRKLQPTFTVTETQGEKAKLVITPEIGVNVFVEVLVDGAKVGELSAGDSSFVFEGSLNQLVLRAYAAGMYASLFRNDTLYSEAIDFSGYNNPILATLNIKVALRNFYKVPVEDSYLQIKNKEKLVWEKKNTVFLWGEPDS